jgi:hypothetical protein
LGVASWSPPIGLGAPKVAVLSDGLWRWRFGGDRATEITLTTTWYTVIGVMPRVFENVLAPSSEL